MSMIQGVWGVPCAKMERYAPVNPVKHFMVCHPENGAAFFLPK